MAKHLSVKGFTGNDWCDLLEQNPQFSAVCPWNSVEFSASHWSKLIARNPAMIAHFPAEKMTDAAPWFEILKINPDYDAKCPWISLHPSAKQWGSLLKVRPDLAERCPWETFSPGDWFYLLRETPLFADRFTHYEKFTGKHWASLLVMQPIPFFEQRCQWDSLAGTDWANLLRWQPQYAEFCTWEKLDEREWQWLLEMQPQFSIYRKKPDDNGKNFSKKEK